MQFLYMKDDVSYVEFLATVYEAENEGTESKVLNVKAKAVTVEKVIDGKERSELKDLKQLIESSTIIKSATIGSVKSKGREAVSSPRKKELFGNSPQKGRQGSSKKGKISLRLGQNLFSVPDVRVGFMGGESVQLRKT